MATAYREGFIYSGQYSRFRRRRHGSSSRDIKPYRFIAFAQNHDQVGNRLLGERLSRLTSLAGLRIAAAAVILAPFIPLLFMGEEYGETAPFYYFVSHGDPDLIESIRRGRAQEFASFGWDKDPLDPQAEETFQSSHPQAALALKEPHQAMWRYYQELLRIRREMLDSVQLGENFPEVKLFEEQAVLMLSYSNDEPQYYIFFCFSDRPEPVNIPPDQGTWHLRLNSAASLWDGPGSNVAETFDSGSAITLPSMSCIVCERRNDFFSG